MNSSCGVFRFNRVSEDGLIYQATVASERRKRGMYAEGGGYVAWQEWILANGCDNLVVPGRFTALNACDVEEETKRR